MQIKVKVITKAKKTFIKEEVGRLKVYLPVAPEKGRANKALIKLLADYYQLPQKALTIISGEKSQHKIIALD